MYSMIKENIRRMQIRVPIAKAARRFVGPGTADGNSLIATRAR